MRVLSSTLVLCLALGCPAPTPEGEEAPEVSAGHEQPIEAAADPETPEAPETARNTRTRLRDLRLGESITYLVQVPGEDREVRLRVEEVAARGDAVAVKLGPVGVPLGEAPLFVGWVIANDHGIFGLEAHVSLAQPGFAPIDPRGELVTEARANVGWHVPTGWWDANTRAFGTDPNSGWHLANAQPEVTGAINGERCVAIARDEGAHETRMQVCENVGIYTIERQTAEGLERWRLLDLGDAPDELRPRE